MPNIVGKDQSIAKQITCRCCGAINEYLPNEVRILHEGKDYGGGYDRQDGFNCGNCGKEVVVRAW